MSPDLLTVPAFSRVTDWLGAWGIEESHGMRLLAQVRAADLFAHIANAPQRTAAAAWYDVAKVGKETVAVVTLTGVLMKSVPSMQQGTSTIEARRAIRKAADDPDVSAILLAIESPGGTVSGTFDLAADIKAAAKKKPVWAQIEDLGASAAYAAASQADKIFANNATAEVGSIGTVMAVYDLSGQAEKEGIKTLVFKTGPIKGAGIPGSVITEEQQAHFQARVDEAQKSFDAAVQKGRGLTDKQLADVKTGGVFGATEALSRKLIDGIQSMDVTISQLAAEARRANRTQSQARAAGPVPMRSKTVNETEQTAGAIAEIATAADAHTKALRESTAAEMDRQAAITKLCAGHPDIAAKAIREGMTPEKAELLALKADIAKGPTAFNPHISTGAGRFVPGKATVGDNVPVSAAVECALLTSLGRRDTEKLFKPEVNEAAHANFRHLGLQQSLMFAAIQNGYQAAAGERIHNGNIRQVLKHAYGSGEDRMAASSTITMSGILGNVANKELLAGYTEEDMTWKEISQVRPVQNFQTHTSYRMLDDMEYEELGADGKIKHGTAGQESYTRAAKTYAKMFALTRRDIINDDLGAFQDIRTRLGRGSAKKFNKIFWAAFMDNSSFFTTGNTNYITGATTNLGTDGVGIGLGVLAFRKMTSPTADGTKRVNADTQNPVGGSPGGRPEILLVPPELEGNAEVIYRNQNLGSVKNSDANIYQNKYRPVVAWQLSNASYTGYSTTAWYLFNSPGYLAPMVVSFLNGMMAPTVESADADFDELGIQFRGYHDFGCDKSEYLAGIKSKGAA